MGTVRGSFQGVANILRFNWHMYVLALTGLIVGLWLSTFLDPVYKTTLILFIILVGVSTLVSLLVSFYVYDRSGLYDFNWIEANDHNGTILNIHAGFDETSELLIDRFKNADLIALDFYDPVKHSEVSIKRARRIYPPHPSTQKITTTRLLFDDNSIDQIFLIFSAHEIRSEAERQLFFTELNRIVKPGGRIYLTEHLRDLPNFLAYNIGFVHFYPKRMWMRLFSEAHLPLLKEIKFTPFISTFILEKHGTTY